MKTTIIQKGYLQAKLNTVNGMVNGKLLALLPDTNRLRALNGNFALNFGNLVQTQAENGGAGAGKRKLHRKHLYTEMAYEGLTVLRQRGARFFWRRIGTTPPCAKRADDLFATA